MSFLYTKFKESIGAPPGTESIDYTNDTIKLALLSSSYSPSQGSHAYFSDIIMHEVSGTGYIAGGIEILNKARTTSGSTIRWTSDPISWTADLSGIQYVVMYKDTGLPNTGILIALWTLDSTKSSSLTSFFNVKASSGYITL